MIAPLGYLPQHAFEVGTAVLSAFAVGAGLLYLIRGGGPGLERFTARTVRLLAGVEILIGAGIGLAGLFVNAEPPCGGCGKNHWGGTEGEARRG